MTDRSTIFNEDGSIKGLRYRRESTTRAACLQISISSGNRTRFATSIGLGEAIGFDAAYKEAVLRIANHYQIPRDHDLINEMLATKQSFLRNQGLTTKIVCIEQVLPQEELDAQRNARPAIEQAVEIQAHIEKLYAEIDTLLDPITKGAVNLPQEELDKLIRSLPSGFHRSELRALYI